jgi:hypothetical protein
MIIIISICSYSLTKISSFSCSGCFQPRVTNFPFLALVRDGPFNFQGYGFFSKKYSDLGGGKKI